MSKYIKEKETKAVWYTVLETTLVTELTDSLACFFLRISFSAKATDSFGLCYLLFLIRSLVYFEALLNCEDFCCIVFSSLQALHTAAFEVFRGGKLLKTLWCWVGGKYNTINWFYQLS